VFEIIDDEKHPPFGDSLAQCIERDRIVGISALQTLTQCQRNVRRISNGRERYERRSVSELVGESPCELERKSRFPNAARTGDCQETHGAPAHQRLDRA
jgi:hypothetical protein